MAGLENNYSLAERVGSQEVCVAILDPQSFQLSGNVRISFNIILLSGTASGKNNFFTISTLHAILHMRLSFILMSS